SPASLAELYQQATVAAVKNWMEQGPGTNLTPQQIDWLNWLNSNALLAAESEQDAAAARVYALLREFRTIEDSIPERARAIGMIEGTGVDENVFIRGNHKTIGEVVPRRFLEALGGSDQTRFTQGSGRFELARSIAHPA